MESNIDMIMSLTKYGFYAICAIVVGHTIVGVVAFWKTDKGAAKTFSMMMYRAQSLKIVTAILIVLSVVYLSLFKIIDGNNAIPVLSGIAGYVLGSIEKFKSEPNDLN